MKKIYLYLIILVTVVGCDDDVLQQPTITFYPNLFLEVDEALVDGETPYTIQMEASMAVTTDSRIQLSVSSDAEYGVNYITNPPELSDGQIVVTMPSGENKASFQFIPINDGIIRGEDFMFKYTITGADGDLESVGQETFTITLVDDDTDPSNCFLTASADSVIASHDFENCPGDFEIPAGFTEAFVEGAKSDRGWGCRPFGRTGQAVQASAFGGDEGVDNSWLIMDPFNADLFEQVSLTFWIESFFQGDGEVHVFYSNNYSGSGDPMAEGVVWFEMGNVQSQLPAAGSREFTEITTAPCMINGEQVYIAFQFVGGTNSNSSSWTIDDVELTGILK